jgi:hypothetical protein
MKIKSSNKYNLAEYQNLNKIFRLGAISGFVFGAMFAISYASQSSGTIDAGFKTSKVCQDTTCTTAAAGIINWKPTGYGMTIDDATGVNGTAWGNAIGWITMNPTGPEGVVVNTATGVLSGYAWSQGAGWINFSPTGYGVTINSAGEFVGWAWTGGASGGWIKFDCADAAACVKTDWRPVPARTVTTPVSSGGGGGGGGLAFIADLCSNLPGVQGVVPTGYTLDAKNANSCISNQILIPATTTKRVKAINTNKAIEPITPNTNVVTVAPQAINLSVDPKTIDYCPNIDGVQTFIPESIVINERGECIYTFTDSPAQVIEEASGIIKYPFVPKAIELSVPTPLTDRPIDLVSISFTILMLYVIRRFVIKTLFGV